MSRKLDAALAEALGENVEWVGGDPMFRYEKYSTWWTGPVPRYSSDGNAMLELDKEMRGRGWMLEIYFADASDEYVVDYEKPNEDIFYSGLADTMPKAVALAAYHALTGKEWTE